MILIAALLVTSMIAVLVLFFAINRSDNNKKSGTVNTTSSSISPNKQDTFSSIVEDAKTVFDSETVIKAKLYLDMDKIKGTLFSAEQDIKENNKVSIETFIKQSEEHIKDLIDTVDSLSTLLSLCFIADVLTKKIDQATADAELSHEQQRQAETLRVKLSELCSSNDRYTELHDFLEQALHNRVEKVLAFINRCMQDVNNKVEQVYRDNSAMINVSNYTDTSTFDINDIIDKIVSDLCAAIRSHNNINTTEATDWLETWSHNPKYILEFCKSITTKIYGEKTKVELLIKKSEMLNHKYDEADIGSEESEALKKEILATLQQSQDDLDELKKLNAIGIEMNERVYAYTRKWIDADEDLDLDLMEMVNELYDINQFIIKYVPETKDRIAAAIDNIRFMDHMDRQLQAHTEQVTSALTKL